MLSRLDLRTLFLLRGVGVLLLVWGIVFGITKLASGARPTPAKILAYGEKHPLGEITDESKRREVIGTVAEMLNQLEPDELRELEEGGESTSRRAFFESMTPEEQAFFLEKRLGRAFQQIMQSFNEMDRDERRRIVQKALDDRKNDPDRDRRRNLEEADPEIVEKITTAGFQSYYQDASAETKLDLAPLMEDIQRDLSRVGGGPR
jgi:hypothetical protein